MLSKDLKKQKPSSDLKNSGNRIGNHSGAYLHYE